jgi:iron complex transport system ATP-binding protein
MLEIKSLYAGYGERLVLEDIDLAVHKGELVALIGPNGAGKTTLLRTISGGLVPSQGKIEVAGRNLQQLSPAQRAAYLAVVPQAHNLPQGFTTWQTVMLGRTPYLGWLGRHSPADRQRVEWAMRRTRLTDLSDRPVGKLSGGEQQRVLLARALAQDTPILLLDEPTSNLDLHHQSLLLNLVKSLASEQGLAVLMALHDLNLAALYADRLALLVHGKLRLVGEPEEVLTPEILAEAYQVPVRVIPHPDYGTPLILPDGRQTRQTVTGL